MDSFQTYFVARQPVFTRRKKIWGYELLFRSSAGPDANVTNPEEATAKVMIDGLSLIFSPGKPNIKALINVPGTMLGSEMLEHLPQESCVLEILEDTIVNEDVLNSLRRLKKHGYTLALDDYTGQPELEELLPLMDIIKVDFLLMDTPSRAFVSKQLVQNGKHLLLAEKVETLEDVQQAIDLGYNLFQGYFFQKPEVMHGRKVPRTLTSRVRAMALLSQEDVDRQDLLEFFTRSPELTFRLLKFVNSAAFAKTRKIQTLSSALAFLGIRPLRHWLLAVLVADAQHGDIGQELTMTGSARAYFMHKMAKHYRLADPDSYFMTGLFSSLEALYGIPFEQLFRTVPVPESVHNALVLNTGPVYPWLQVSQMLGRGMLRKAERLLSALGVSDMSYVARCHQEAMRWTRDTIL